MKFKVEFSFGVDYRGDWSGILVHERAAGLKEIFTRALDLFGGYAVSETWGGYGIVMDGGPEHGRCISVLTDSGEVLTEQVQAMVQQIKDSLQQSSVAVTKTGVHFDIL